MDPKKFSQGLIHIYDAAYSPEAWTNAMEACQKMTAAAHIMYFSRSLHEDITFSALGGSPSLFPHAGHIQEYNRRFEGVSGYDDVGEAFLNRAEVGEPVLDTDIWSLEFLQNRAELLFNRDGMGIFRKMYANISPDPLMSSVAIFFYNQQINEIPTTDLEAARLFSPHLMKALDLSRWADGLRQKYNAVLSVLDQIKLGICISNERGDIILHNKHASEIFDNKDGLWLGQDRKLMSRDSDIIQRIQSAIQSVSKTAIGEDRVNSVEISVEQVGSTGSLLVIASPLRDADMELERNLTGCLLTIVDMNCVDYLRLDAFGDAYKLTPAEKSAAVLLVSGLTTPEIAEELGVAKSTAHTHVMSAFEKTRSSNRVSFVWKAVQYAPPLV